MKIKLKLPHFHVSVIYRVLCLSGMNNQQSARTLGVLKK